MGQIGLLMVDFMLDMLKTGCTGDVSKALKITLYPL